MFTLVAFSVLVTAILVHLNESWAAPIAQINSDPTQAVVSIIPGGGGAAVWGFRFSTNLPLLVTDLGIADIGPFPSGDLSDDGLITGHSVGLWTDSGSLIASATVGPGTGDTLLSGFRYTSISPVTLPAGETFRIAVGFPFFSGAPTDLLDADLGALGSRHSFDPAITWLSPARAGGEGLVFPSDTSPIVLPGFINVASALGPNFQFSVAPPPQSDLIVENLSVDPTSGQVGSQATVSFRLRNQGGGTANASTTNIRLAPSSTNVTTSDPLLVGFSTPSIAAGETLEVSQPVTIPAVEPGGYFIWVIVDVNNTGNQSDTINDRVNTSFTVAPAPPLPVLFVTPETLDFGSVTVGSSKDLDFTVQNTGGGTLSGTASVVAPFSIVAGSPFNLFAGQSRAVTVRFDPTSIGPFPPVDIEVTSNGGNALVEVHGIAVPPPPHISGISPPWGPVGSPATVIGENFGVSQGSSVVSFSSNAASVIEWGATQIQVTVPSVPATNISYEVTVRTPDGVSNSVPFVVIGASSGGGVNPPGRSGLHPSPGPATRRIILDFESSNQFRVLGVAGDVTLISLSDLSISDITIENNWQAWYIVSILPTGQVGEGLPSSFLIGPGAKRTFRLTFRRGESILFSADGTFHTPPETTHDLQLLSVFGAELLWRAFFGSPMPQNLAEFALELAKTPGSGLNPLARLALCVVDLDVICAIKRIEEIRDDPFLSTQLELFGVPVIEKINILKQFFRLLRTLEFLANEFLAAVLFPFDTLTIRAR